MSCTLDAVSGKKLVNGEMPRDELATHKETDTGLRPVMELQVSLDELTFDAKREQEAHELDALYAEKLNKKKKQWEKEIARMKAEFLRLRPEENGDGTNLDETGKENVANLSEKELKGVVVPQRKGSTEFFDGKSLKTTTKEHPTDGRRFRLRFDVSEFDRKTLQVIVKSDNIVVQASRTEEVDGEKVEKRYVRKIEKPKEIDTKKVKSSLTSDGILTIDSSLPPRTLNLRKHLPHLSPSHSSQDSSKSPSTSPNTPPTLMSTSLISSTSGVSILVEPPTFEEKDGVRYLSLSIPLGPHYKPKDIIVQAIKDNRLLVQARHEDRGADKMLMARFNKEYDLPERINTLSLRAALQDDGRLCIGALAKASGIGLSREEAGELSTQNINALQATPCNVVDLSSFPPVSCQICR